MRVRKSNVFNILNKLGAASGEVRRLLQKLYKCLDPVVGREVQTAVK